MWLRNSILIAWGVFWIYWLIAAFGSKRSSNRVLRPPLFLFLLAAFLLLRAIKVKNLAVHSLPLHVVGVALFAVGLALAVWARVYLGRNWGMPMTEKEEPELVTSGPYRFVRHPIYSGILLGVLGTGLAVNFYWLLALTVMGAYFIYSARVEERILSASFPSAYPAYRQRTKMLIPFLL